MCFGVPSHPTAPGARWSRAPIRLKNLPRQAPTRSRLTVSGHPRSAACWRHCERCSLVAVGAGRRPASRPPEQSMAMAAKLTALAPDLRQDRIGQNLRGT
jgi:hypothetical protein